MRFVLLLAILLDLASIAVAQPVAHVPPNTGNPKTNWSSLPPDAQRAIMAALEKDDPGWTQQAELTASGANNFGISVAVDGSTAVVGARTNGPNSTLGAAYVFVESGGTWSQQAELTASDGATDDQFGYSVAVSGSTIVVGAPQHPFSLGGSGPGKAYVFVENGGTWSQQAELKASDGAVGDSFGYSVAASGGAAVVGAPGHMIGSNQAQGAVYVFAPSGGTWSQQAELTAADGSRYNGFGTSVGVSGGTALAGAPSHEVGSNGAQGAAYVFGSPMVTLSPASLSFGNEVINTTSAARTVVLTNLGNATLIMSSIIISGDFAISRNTCGGGVVVGQKCQVEVTFTPPQLGRLTGTLTFTDNAPGSPQTVPLSGTGVEPATLTPAHTIYSAQKVGTTSAAKTFTLANNQPVSLTSIAISTSGDFAVSTTTCGTSLATRAKCTISVTFTPTAAGTRTGQLVINDSASNSPQTSDLTGTGK